MMMEHKQTILLAPSLSNSSCWRGGTSEAWTGPGPGELVRATLILLLSLGILCANLLVICVINSKRYSKYIHAQPRYLLTSLASNDLAIGLLVTPFSFLPAVYGCWPYGEVVCQIQALLRGALTQQSAVILVCMAIDRYICMLHPHRYHKHSSKRYYMRQGCVAVMSTTWIASVAVFGVLVLPRGGYYFNGSGLLACDPFFSKASLRILVCCCFYFPTTMVLMYCYGSAFHVNKLRLKRVVCVNTPEVVSGGHIERLVAHERRLSTSASRTMAAMSLGFIVMVTPWTIQEVVAACTGSKPPPFLEFLATWLALSNSFWNPFLYWLLNNHFRRISKELFYSKILCRSKPLGAKQHCCATSTGGLDVCSIAGVDLSGLDRCSMERYSMARCSSLSLANTPPPLSWEAVHVTHGDAESTQRCRHADGGFRISGRHQLVQRGGMPAPNTPALPDASVCTPTPARRRCTLVGTRASLARRGKGGERGGGGGRGGRGGGARRPRRRDDPASSTRSTSGSLRVHALGGLAGPRATTRTMLKLIASKSLSLLSNTRRYRVSSLYSSPSPPRPATKQLDRLSRGTCADIANCSFGTSKRACRQRRLARRDEID